MIKKIYTFIVSNKRKCWYLILLGASTIYVILQRNTIGPLSVLTVENLVFYMWLLLLLFPLFSEMEFMGIKLKKEVQKATKEVKDSINDLKMQIMDLTISNSSANYMVNSFGIAPSKEEVMDIVKNTRKPPEANTPTANDSDEIVTDETVYLFKVRLTLENALRAYCGHLNCNEHSTATQLLNIAISNGFLDRKNADYIKQIITICNRGIHGEIVSNEYIDFIKSVLPQVLAEIDSVTSRMGYKHLIVCPRCKYAGYTKQENVCPQCGYVTNDN